MNEPESLTWKLATKIDTIRACVNPSRSSDIDILVSLSYVDNARALFHREEFFDSTVAPALNRILTDKLYSSNTYND